MNSASDAVSDSRLQSEVIAPANISTSRLLYWSVQRELWENRFLYIAPLSIAVVFLFGFLVSTIHLPTRMRGLSGVDPVHYREAIAMPYDIASGLMMLVCIIVSVFYCADALHGERRDRSILFWKSLPVSDLTTVLAKASIPLVLLPLFSFAIAVTMSLIMLLVSSAVLLGNGLSVVELWKEMSFFRMSLLLLYHFVTAHALWPFPVYCWLLLVSAWARRAVLLWASLPVVAIAALEGILFHSAHFAALIGSRLIGAAPALIVMPSDEFPSGPMTHITPERFLGSPGLWIGLLLSAGFLIAAMRVRRYQGPI